VSGGGALAGQFDSLRIGRSGGHGPRKGRSPLLRGCNVTALHITARTVPSTSSACCSMAAPIPASTTTPTTRARSAGRSIAASRSYAQLLRQRGPGK